MPVRTVKLKLVLGKSAAIAPIRKALWTTHCEVNRGVARITETLLLCRGESYWTRDANGSEVVVSRAEVRKNALAMARDAQRKNANTSSRDTLTDDEVLSALRRLYEDIVPSCCLDDNGKPLDGDAQASNKWVSPLMDPDSSGNMAVFDKILDPSPVWIESKQQGDASWEMSSLEWLKTAEAQRLQRATGSPPSWVRKLRLNQPWQDALIADQQKKIEETKKGTAPLTRELKLYGLLPLFHPSKGREMAPAPAERRIYDRLAMRLAVAHLLSWENWNHRTIKAHNSAKEKWVKVAAEGQTFQHAVDRVRTYEAARHEELKRVALADDDRPFRIGFRTIRAWDRVRETWLRRGKTASARVEQLAEIQTALRGKFGDPDFFRWLAGDSQQVLWTRQDVVEYVARLNSAERNLARRKSFAVMTLADPRVHPRWAMCEAPGGSNLRTYQLIANENGLAVVLPLLVRDEMGHLTEKSLQVPLAPSEQFSDFQFLENTPPNHSNTRISFRSAHQQFTASLGGAELLLHRPFLQNPERTDASLTHGAIGPAWLKLSIDLDSKAPASWLRANGKPDTPAGVHHFNTALSNRSKHTDKLEPGLRVLSVDLGLRTFASCSVFELKHGKPTTGLYFPAADDRPEDHPDKLWAVHERSFQLKLPGESPTKSERDARQAAFRPLKSLRRDINRLKEILRLSIVTDISLRNQKLQGLLDTLAISESDSVLSLQDFSPLAEPASRASDEHWQSCCQQVYRAAEQKVSEAFSRWRSDTRPRPNSWEDWRARRAYHGGKSIWTLEYLDSIRKLILSWNLRGQAYGQINRQDRVAWGTVARGLLEHLNHLKTDRTKSGADLVIQSARGLVPAESGTGWSQKYAPCRVILFEDLSRYRFRVDRPRRENSQLMKWNHREIIREVTLQSEIYAIAVETTEAGYSSRYLASTGQPGCRCRTLNANDFDEGIPKPYVVNELENWPQLDLRTGAVVPWDGGELFATLSQSGIVHIINADLNAAQNLQRRFWGRCGDAYRISCRARVLSGKRYFEMVGPDPGDPDKIPARRLGALQRVPNWQPAQLLSEQPEGGLYRWEQVSGARGRKLKRTAEAESPEEDLFEEAFEEVSDDQPAGQVTLFRDPTGIFFDERIWAEARIYWGRVKGRLTAALALAATSNGPKGEQDDELPF